MCFGKWGSTFAAAPPAGASYPQHDFSNWDLAFLADYIYNVHHRYIRENAPVLENLSMKVASRHSTRHGRVLRTVMPGPNALQTSISLNGLAPGIYKVQWSDSSNVITGSLLVK